MSRRANSARSAAGLTDEDHRATVRVLRQPAENLERPADDVASQDT